jgi:hypothetical protein
MSTGPYTDLRLLLHPFGWLSALPINQSKIKKYKSRFSLHHLFKLVLDELNHDLAYC